MRDHYPFIVRLQDGREWRGYARDVSTAEAQAQARLGCNTLTIVAPGKAVATNPAVLVIRADEPFVRKRRGWLSRLLFGPDAHSRGR